jgi:hypothetical protein
VAGQSAAADAAADAEKLRKKQMNLDVMRRRREIIRESQVARGLALNNAASQGASEGSGIAGGLAQISATAASGQSALNQNLEIGNKIFAANIKAAKAQKTVAFGQGLQQVGGTLMANSDKIEKIGGSLFNGS